MEGEPAMTERDEMIEKAAVYWLQAPDGKLLIEIMADFALSVKPKPIDWEVLLSRYTDYAAKYGLNDYEIFNWLREQPEFN